jgi:hypothetical protein
MVNMSTTRPKALAAFASGMAVLAMGLALGAATTPGCSSSSSSASGGKDAASGADSTTGTDTGAGGNDAGPDGADGGDATSGNDASTVNDAAGDTGSTDSGDGGLVVLTALPITDQISSMAVNAVTGVVYAAILDGNGNSLGIDVIDDSTVTVTTTIAPVTVDGGTVKCYSVMAVDETNNVIYGARQFSNIVDVFNGATNAYLATIDVGGLDTQCGFFGIHSMAVDGTRSLFYSECASAANPAGVEVSVISTSGSYSLVKGMSLTDLPSTLGAGSLALDTTNQLLFVTAGGGLASSTPIPSIVVDPINTATNQEMDAGQQNLGAGYLVGTVGVPGSAVAVIQDNSADAGPLVDGGYNSGAFASLEPQFDPLGASLPNGLTTLRACSNGHDYMGFQFYTVTAYSPSDPDQLYQFNVTAYDDTAHQPDSVFMRRTFASPVGAGDLLSGSVTVCGANHCYMLGVDHMSGGGTAPVSYSYETPCPPPCQELMACCQITAASNQAACNTIVMNGPGSACEAALMSGVYCQ